MELQFFAWNLSITLEAAGLVSHSICSSQRDPNFQHARFLGKILFVCRLAYLRD